MAYIRWRQAKDSIEGVRYAYLCHSTRQGRKVRQKTLAYLGRFPLFTDELKKELAIRYPNIQLNWAKLEGSLKQSYTDVSILTDNELWLRLRELRLERNLLVTDICRLIPRFDSSPLERIPSRYKWYGHPIYAPIRRAYYDLEVHPGGTITQDDIVALATLMRLLLTRLEETGDKEGYEGTWQWFLREKSCQKHLRELEKRFEEALKVLEGEKIDLPKRISKIEMPCELGERDEEQLRELAVGTLRALEREAGLQQLWQESKAVLRALFEAMPDYVSVITVLNDFGLCRREPLDIKTMDLVDIWQNVERLLKQHDLKISDLYQKDSFGSFTWYEKDFWLQIKMLGQVKSREWLEKQVEATRENSRPAKKIMTALKKMREACLAQEGKQQGC